VSSDRGPLELAASTVSRRLPLTARATSITLVVGESAGEGWTTAQQFPLDGEGRSNGSLC
jgi:hypothetical protein